MKKILILLCLTWSAVSCVREGSELGKCPLRVTCRDVTGPQSSNILNIWAGYCSSPEKIDIGYLKNIDGTVVPEIAGYEFVYLDPTSVLAAGPIEMTAWYRPSIFSLNIYYKNIVSGSDIYPSLQLSGLQSGLTIDREFMENNGYLPDIANFVYDHFELNVIPGSNEGILNVWYDPVFTAKIRYTTLNADIDIDDPVIIKDLRRGTIIDLDYLINNGYRKYMIEYQGMNWFYRILTPEEYFVDSHIEILIRYAFD